MPKGELHVVGDGELREELEKWAKQNGRVKIYGKVADAELNRIYDNCDVLIFPSICVEGWGMVITEALRHGLAVIASDTGGVSEVINDVAGCFLVKPGDERCLREKMLLVSGF
jgi:glycosyltransferase involved in cell wall biosynthesis